MECLTLTGGGLILTTFYFSADRQIFSSVKNNVHIPAKRKSWVRGTNRINEYLPPSVPLLLPLEMRWWGPSITVKLWRPRDKWLFLPLQCVHPQTLRKRCDNPPFYPSAELCSPSSGSQCSPTKTKHTSATNQSISSMHKILIQRGI